MNPDLKVELKSLKTVYSALIVGVVSFLGITVFVNSLQGAFIKNDEFMSQMLLLIVNLFALSSITGGLFVFKSRMKNIKNISNNEKFSKYKEAMIIRGATIEGSSFFFIVSYLLVGTNILLIEALVSVVILILFFPTNNRIAKDIKIDLSEFF